MNNKLTEIFKAYDIRGIVDQNINGAIVEAIAAAYVDTLNLAGKNILIGHDMRDSSPKFAQQFALGATKRAANAIIIGLSSTDQLYFASGHYKTAGVMFTASHNPAQYNGIKLVRPSAQPISNENGLQEIQTQAEKYLQTSIPTHENPGTINHKNVLEDYAKYLRKLVNLTHIRPLKIVVDAGNGMAGLTTPAVLGNKILDKLPLEIVELYFKLDGTFPNHPANPLEPENLVDLQEAVIKHKADLGLAFDGDADRCFVIDEKGNPISPSAITALIALREIEKEKQAGKTNISIIHNLITSKTVPEMVKAAGATPIRTRVGHSFIKTIMAEKQAVFGGEHSAHYYFRDFWNADTGMLAAMHILAALGKSEIPLSKLAQKYSLYAASGEINTKVVDIPKTIQKINHFFSQQNTTSDNLDGLTFNACDNSWWFNLRASNTEPYLRLNVEAKTANTMSTIRDQVLNLIKS